MKRGNKTDALRRRMGAATVAVTVLWTVFVSAGSATLGEAVGRMGRQGELGVALLRAQLGDRGNEEDLLPRAAELVIAQSPLLLSARKEVLALRSAEEEEEEQPQPPQQRPIREEPLEVAPPAQHPFADNGVAAKTLVPSSEEGYVRAGAAYIANDSDKEVTASIFDTPFAARLGTAAPQVLIVHTHGSEAYTMPPGEAYEPSGDCRTTDCNYNVVRIGDEIAAVLADYGISSVHDRALYDYPAYSGAYNRSLEAIESYLEKYPDISFVLDVHRDAISDGDGTPYKLISVEEEGTAAQLSFVMGTDGSGLSHSGWQDNLRFAAAVQNTILAEHPTLMRPIVVRNARYNQHCTPGSLLVEVGAAGNSLEEALLAAKLFAEGFAETVLAGERAQ